MTIENSTLFAANPEGLHQANFESFRARMRIGKKESYCYSLGFLSVLYYLISMFNKQHWTLKPVNTPTAEKSALRDSTAHLGLETERLTSGRGNP